LGIYSTKVAKRLKELRHCAAASDESAHFTDASFICGSFVRFSLTIDTATRRVETVRFKSSGCGYMVAAADVIAQSVEGRALADLHALSESDLMAIVSSTLGAAETGRHDCIDCVISALRGAFADYRARQIEEFRGEKALICTCFGVTEEAIEARIEERSLTTVDEVGAACNAGTGCGSCRMLIQEMLDTMV
jgi:NifU-like protein